MRAWQEGISRIYNPIDNRHTFITMPGHIHWPRLDPTEESEIRALMAPPWIPDGQAMEGLNEEHITELDILHQLFRDDAILHPHTHTHTHTQHHTQHHTHRELELLESVLRPTLLMEMPMTLLPTPQLVASSSAARPQPFPTHLVDQVLAAAEAAGQICAITMEPIKTTTAAVTSCGHIFQKAAIDHWMQDHDTCPECRQPCSRTATAGSTHV